MIRAMARARFFCVAVVAVRVLVACAGPRLPHPPYVSHPTSALEMISHPAPPALVESVPDKPATNAVWVDGEWRLSARQWRWTHGVWVAPPADLAFSPPVEVRSADGTLYFAPGTWRNAQGEAVDEPEPLVTARGGGVNSVVNPSGESEDVKQSRSGEAGESTPQRTPRGGGEP